jgi:hypothetical protein
MELDAFLQLPTEEVFKLAQNENAPKLGIFIPDGNRRLMLIKSDVKPETDEYYSQLADEQTSCGLKAFRTFFEHGLPVLFTPLFSRAVLERNPTYRVFTARRTLETIFRSDEWLNFYHDLQIRIKVYGNRETLNQPDYENINRLIDQVEEITKIYSAHTLYIGIGGEPWVGWDVAFATIRYFEKLGRHPIDKKELIEFMYGNILPPANFVVFSGKPGGLGALPSLISGKNTQIFYLPAPGVIALNQTTYRKILHNLLYVKKGGYNLNQEKLEELRNKYKGMENIVVGLGQNVGSVWIPDTES